MNRYVIVTTHESGSTWLMTEEIFSSVLEASECAQNYCEVRKPVPWEIFELKELD